ncbi:hypothetical protein GCM10009528_19830 [Kineococcus aurantiacus]
MAAAGLLTLGAGLAAAAPAAAHDRLESTSPGTGAVLDAAPGSVVLTMSTTPLALGTQVQVTGPDGTVVSGGDPRIVDTTVTADLTGARPAGTYEVQWRITSSDGHPVSGSFTFTATGAAASSASPSAPASATPSATPSATASASTSPATVDPSNPTAGQGDDALIGVGLVVVAVVGVVGGVIGYRRRQG